MPGGSSSDCPHLECVGEITKEELIQKSHVSMESSIARAYSISGQLFSCVYKYLLSFHTKELLKGQGQQKELKECRNKGDKCQSLGD